jgi:hypothetical protein
VPVDRNRHMIVAELPHACRSLDLCLQLGGRCADAASIQSTRRVEKVSGLAVTASTLLDRFEARRHGSGCAEAQVPHGTDEDENRQGTPDEQSRVHG